VAADAPTIARWGVGHHGGIAGYVSLLAVVPEHHLSVALLIDDDAKDVESIMNKLFAALR
jgi:hypothetical protein